MEALGKPQDGVDPVPEGRHTLSLVQHSTVAEDQLFRFWIRPVVQNNNITVSVSSLA